MPRRKPPKKELIDPHGVPDKLVTVPIGVSRAGGMVHIALGVERPSYGEPGQLKNETVVVDRLFMPLAVAIELAHQISQLVTEVASDSEN
ncbi:MAG: hypothetical protein ACR2PO_03590 [Methyloligellaceae bacterium]